MLLISGESLPAWLTLYVAVDSVRRRPGSQGKPEYLTTMPKLTVVTRTGDEIAIEDARPGASVMELMRDNDVPDLLALCGGSRSCATCHIWVDPAFIDQLPAAVEEENELLESSMYRKPTSRLSCQIKWSNDLDGLRVTLAPED